MTRPFWSLRKSGRGEEEVLEEEEEKRNEPKEGSFLISYLRKIIGGLSFVFFLSFLSVSTFSLFFDPIVVSCK